MIFIFIILIAIILCLISVVFGAVYVASVDWAVEEMIGLADVKKGQKAVDLGSGNGKIVIALAKRGIKAHGYEINPLLVVWSHILIRSGGVQKNSYIHLGNMFSVDVSSYDRVFIFVVPYLMKRLEKKLRKELKKGAVVVVESFPFPTWKPEKKVGSFYIYKN